jgi:DNA-binding transcriptional MerR regulator
MHEQFLHRDILNIFPWLKPRTLISWSERGLIKPDFSNAAGRGSSRVYSYANLIEIGIVSEFLGHGIPFSIIEGIMNGSAVTKMKEEKDFHVVIWSDRTIHGVTAQLRTTNQFSAQTTSGTVPLSMAGWPHGQAVKPFTRVTADTSACVKIDDFLAHGGKLLLGGGREDVTSVLIVNVRGIKMYVDRQIRGMK